MPGSNPTYINRLFGNSIPFSNYPNWGVADRRLRNNFTPQIFPYGYAPIMPPVFQQQNNFYSNYNPVMLPSQLIQAMNLQTNKMVCQYGSKLNINSFQRKIISTQKQPTKSNFIEISDDQECQPLPQAPAPKPPASTQQLKSSPEVIILEKAPPKVIQEQKPFLPDNRQIDDEETKRITRKINRIQKKEPISVKNFNKTKEIKKRRIKQKKGYKLSTYEKQLLELSKLRDYNAQILVGPSFQVELPQSLIFSEELFDWKNTLRDNLLKRIQY